MATRLEREWVMRKEAAGNIGLRMKPALEATMKEARAILGEIGKAIKKNDPQATIFILGELKQDDPFEDYITFATMNGKSGRSDFFAQVVYSKDSWDILTNTNGNANWANSVEEAVHNINLDLL